VYLVNVRGGGGGREGETEWQGLAHQLLYRDHDLIYYDDDDDDDDDDGNIHSLIEWRAVTTRFEETYIREEVSMQQSIRIPINISSLSSKSFTPSIE